MAAVYTDPKGYKAAQPVDYLYGEDKTLYNGLGPVTMNPAVLPTTQKMSALAYFQLGVQLLNLLWYDVAILKFQEAQKLDPGMRIAYWGEAMCYKKPLWQEEDLDKAQAVFAKMDQFAPNPASDREEAYIDAARDYLSPNLTLQIREISFFIAMSEIYTSYPDDADACGLAGLAMLGRIYSIGDYLSDDMKAKAFDGAMDWLTQCSSYHPNHAGTLLYLTVLYDSSDKSTAQGGIGPALQLAKVAPASNVAQHMGSHIFMRLGNWSQVVSENQAAVAASDSYCNAMKLDNSCDADNRWHALEWLLYGQTQQCAFTAATASYQRMQSVAASMNYSGDYALWLYRTYAHLQLQSLNLLGAVPLRSSSDNAISMLPPPVYDATTIQDAADISDHFWPPHAEANALLARVSSLVVNRTAAQQQAPDAQATISAALARLDAIVAQQLNLTAAAGNDTAASKPNEDMTALLQSVRLQAYALISAAACAGGNTTSCNNTLSLMDQAMQLYNSTLGSAALPTLRIAPVPEFYGNLLLMQGNASAAAAMFDVCLGQLPNRMQCVLGQARAAASMGNSTGSAFWYKQLLAQCAPGDASFPPLVAARAAVGANAPPPAGGKRGALLRRGLRADPEEIGDWGR